MNVKKDTNHSIDIEIQYVFRCKEIKGIKIETTEQSVNLDNFQNCKKYGEIISASFISYSNKTKMCSNSKEPFVKIVRDINSSLFIYESTKNTSTSTTATEGTMKNEG